MNTIFATGIAKLMEDPMETLYSFAFLFAFIVIVIDLFLRRDDHNDKD